MPGRTAPTPQTTGELFVIKSDNGEREKKRGKDEEGFSYLFLFHFKLNSLSPQTPSQIDLLKESSKFFLLF